MKKAALLYAAMFLVLCGAGIASAQSQSELVVAQTAEVNSLDPARHNSVTDINYAVQVFDMLYGRDDQGKPIPRLALSHRIVNPTTWEFKLRPGVTFHNGAAMTAKDVKFSIDRMIDPQTKALFASFWEPIKEVKVVDNLTVQVITKAPDPLLLKRLSMELHIMPADLFQKEGAEAFFQHPVGTGPFKFVSWNRNDRMVLEANGAYWDGAPKIKRLIIRPIPEAATRLAELQTGKADIIAAIPPFLVDQVKATPTVTVQSIPGGRVIFLYVNSLAKGPLQDKRVRQALNYAVDRKAIISNILKGSGVEIADCLTRYHFGYDPSLQPYSYDPAKAKKLLAEAGYAKGLKLVFNSPNGRFILDKEIAEAIAGMFRAVGIETEMKVHEWGSYVQIMNALKLEDIGFIGWGNTLSDADGTFTPLFTPGPFSYYNNPALTEKIAKARTTMDEKARLRLYKDIEKELFDEAAVTYLYEQVDHYGVSRSVKDFHARGDEWLIVDKASK
jgi:peptide/nickel transport system substrate-binding protein